MIPGAAPVLVTFDNRIVCECRGEDFCCLICGGSGFVDEQLFVDREDVEPVKISRKRRMSDDFRNHKLELWTSNSFRRFHMSDGASGAFACEPITQNDGHPDLLFPGGPDGPVARRFLATWNACKGYSVAALEYAAANGGFALIVSEAILGGNTQDALTNALREIELRALHLAALCGSAAPERSNEARAIAAMCAAALAGK